MHRDVNKDMDRVINEADKLFKEMDKVFKSMENTVQESWEAMNKRQKWEPYISWIPRKIGRRWYWHSPIYRKYHFDSQGGWFEYGTEFDVLKDS